MNWIKHPVKLEGEKVLLLPLAEAHFEELINASQEEKIWEFMPVKGSDKEKLRAELENASKKRSEDQYPFTVFDKENSRIIGCTRYLKLNEEHRNLEIGFTWYSPAYWGKGYNEECKLLLRTHCFEELRTIRVQIVASDKNVRSRRAIERIGASFEGVLRNGVFRNGEKRSAAFYSITDEEWASVKPRLAGLYKEKYRHNGS